MVSSSSSIFSSIFSVGVKLTGEFISLEEPIDDSDTAIVVVLSADGSDFDGSERRIDPMEPTRKLRLSIIRSIPSFKLAKIGVWAGW
jgi:hypothetical protein